MLKSDNLINLKSGLVVNTVISFSDQALRDTYNRCAEGLNTHAQGSKPIWEYNDILDTYNNIFALNDGYLHGWMVMEVQKVIMLEMADRFLNQA